MEYENIKSNNKFVFIDILTGYLDLLFILFGIISFFFFLSDQHELALKNLFVNHPKTNDLIYIADIFKSAAIVTAIVLLITISKSLKQRNLRYNFYDNYIEQYDTKAKTAKKFVGIKQFNHIDIYESKYYIAAEFNFLTGGEPKHCFKIYASHRNERKFLEGIYKSAGFTGNIEEYFIDNQKTNSHNISGLVKLLVYLSITAAVMFFPALRHLKFLWISAIMFSIIAIPLIIFEIKEFINKDVVNSSITNNGLKIQKGNRTNYLLYSAINVCDVISGKNTDDILVHCSRRKSGKQVAKKEFLIEGIPKSESARINKLLEDLSKYGDRPKSSVQGL